MRSLEANGSPDTITITARCWFLTTREMKIPQDVLNTIERPKNPNGLQKREN